MKFVIIGVGAIGISAVMQITAETINHPVSVMNAQEIEKEINNCNHDLFLITEKKELFIQEEIGIFTLNTEKYLETGVSNTNNNLLIVILPILQLDWNYG